MSLNKAGAAAREAAASVAMKQGSPHRWRNRAGSPHDLNGTTVEVVLHHYTACITREAPGRFRGNVRTILQHGLAGGIWVREDRGVDVDHHLVVLGGSAGIDAMMQGRLGEQRERVGLLLSHRVRFPGIRIRVPRARSLLQRL